jgi:hypothetical protein
VQRRVVVLRWLAHAAEPAAQAATAPPGVARLTVADGGELLIAQFIDEDEEFVPNAEPEAGGKAMLDELARLTGALRQLRAAA